MEIFRIAWKRVRRVLEILTLYCVTNKMFLIQSHTVNGVNLFVSGWGFWTTWLKVIVWAVPTLVECCKPLIHRCINTEGPHQVSVPCPHAFHLGVIPFFTDILWLLRPLFCPFLNLSDTSRSCMGFTCTEMKTKILISFTSFVTHLSLLDVSHVHRN